MARGHGENYERHDAPDEKENQEAKREGRESELPAHFESRYKLKASERYEANGYNYETDKLGRIKRAEGTLRLENENKADPNSQRMAGGDDRRRKDDGWESVDDGGHYFARRFGGSEKIDNLFAQDRHLNRSEYKKMENEFEAKLKERNEDGSQKYKVDVRIDSKYKGDSERPSTIFVRAKYTDSDGNVERKVYMFKNEADDNTRVKNL